MGPKIKSLVKSWASTHKGWVLDETNGVLIPAKGTKKEDIERRATVPSFIKSARQGEVELIGGATKALNPEEKIYISGLANEHSTDRMDEVLTPSGIVLDAYMKNSVLLLQHCHDWPIGLVTVLNPQDHGVEFEAWIGDPRSAPLTPKQIEARSLVAQRILKAVSVGFIPLKIRMPLYNDNGYMEEPARIEQWEMLELSIVSVPCNAGSLFDLKNEGGKETKTSTSSQVFNSDKKGATVNKDFPLKEKEMDQILEVLQGIKTVMDSIAAGQSGLKDQLSGIQTALDAKKPAENPDGEGKPSETPPAEEEGKGAKKPGCDEDEDMKAVKARIDGIENSIKSLTESFDKVAGALLSKLSGE